VDEVNFRYPGPSPRSKETALLMLADGVEARARAEHPQDEDQVRAIVRGVIERVQKDGQLENTPLSQQDLAVITESFINTLRVTFHPRLAYPQEPPAPSPSTGQDQPTVPAAPRAKKNK
jgi:membrane-associated HD superfamily phosphohydrolase